MLIKSGPDEAGLPGSFDVRNYNRPGYQLSKRVFDLILASVGLLVLFPVFIVISLVIFFQNGSPVIFRQKRIKQGGESFHIFKFRSMVKNAEEVLKANPELMEEYQRTFKIARDPRLLKIGGFLRSTSLDELPQLLNVIAGEMSLVGPRPIVEKEIEKYGEFDYVYLAMKPGCAGLWQCSGRSLTTYEERIALDTQYLQKASFWFDLQVLWRTLVTIVMRRGAH